MNRRHSCSRASSRSSQNQNSSSSECGRHILVHGSEIGGVQVVTAMSKCSVTGTCVRSFTAGAASRSTSVVLYAMEQASRIRRLNSVTTFRRIGHRWCWCHVLSLWIAPCARSHEEAEHESLLMLVQCTQSHWISPHARSQEQAHSRSLLVQCTLSQERASRAQSLFLAQRTPLPVLAHYTLSQQMAQQTRSHEPALRRSLLAQA